MCSVWQRIQHLEFTEKGLETRLSTMPDADIDIDLFGETMRPTWRCVEDAELRKSSMAYVIDRIDQIEVGKAPLWTEFDKLRKDHGLDKVKRY
jgi:hypothetical protein